jgi:signal transduction histidine kinase
MFSQIKKRLTLFYLGVMTCFLLAFVGTTYIGLTWAIYSTEKQEMLLFLEEEAKEHVILLKNKELLQQTSPVENYREGNGKMFYYAFDNRGSLIDTAQPYQALQSTITGKIAAWDAGYGRVVLFTVNVKDNHALLMMASLPIMTDEERLGTIYVGRDVTGFYQVLKTVFIVLSGVSLVFLLCASIGGYVMAGRAMIPIKKSYKRQQEFVADASHELRTPLSVLMASVDVVQGDDGSNLSSSSQQVLGDMREEIKRMSKILGDMLTLARTDAAVIPILKKRFNLKIVAEKVIRSLQPLASENQVTLSLDGPEEIWLVADQERLDQLLSILVNNAIKYTLPKGQVWIKLAIVAKHSRAIKITVKDTGIGIPVEYQQLIFERFYRVDKVRSRSIGGTGLGLAIAHWTVAAHGGNISVDSQEGKGSTFTVILPQENTDSALPM